MKYCVRCSCAIILGYVQKPNTIHQWGIFHAVFQELQARLNKFLLVMVMAEPGFPLPDEVYSGEPEEDLKVLLSSRYLRLGENQFHRNILQFLDDVFPMFAGNVDELLKRVWLTQSRHCSIAQEIGNIRKSDRLICTEKHLLEQVKMFPNAIILLAGGKAKQVKKLVRNSVECGAFAPPGCNQFKVRKSQAEAVEKVKRHIRAYL